jgi:hypothetical protein
MMLDEVCVLMVWLYVVLFPSPKTRPKDCTVGMCYQSDQQRIVRKDQAKNRKACKWSEKRQSCFRQTRRERKTREKDSIEKERED